MPRRTSKYKFDNVGLPSKSNPLIGMPLLAVDVGVNSLGWATWDYAPTPSNIMPPVTCGTMTTPADRKANKFDKALRLVDWFNERVLYKFSNWCDPRKLVVAFEMPEYREGDEVGHAAASRDDLGALYAAFGAHGLKVLELSHALVWAKPQQWKGQLSKSTTLLRIQRAIGDCAQDGTAIISHAADAVGLGLVVSGNDINNADVFGNKE